MNLTSKRFSYNNVKLNYMLVALAVIANDGTLGTVAGPSHPCIMHTIFCDIRMRLYPPTSTLLPAMNSHGVPRRSARLSGQEGGPHRTMNFEWRGPSTVTNRTANIGNLKGSMRAPLQKEE